MCRFELGLRTIDQGPAPHIPRMGYPGSSPAARGSSTTNVEPSLVVMAAVMTGSSQEDYAKMMLGGGRSIEGNRSKSGANKPGGSKSGKSKPKARSKSRSQRG